MNEYEWTSLHDGPSIRIYPQGGLKLIRFSGLDSWTSILPGLVGIVGLLGNKLVFRRRWVVEVRPSAHSDDRSDRFVVGNRASAELCVKKAGEWQNAHGSLTGFAPN